MYLLPAPTRDDLATAHFASLDATAAFLSWLADEQATHTDLLACGPDGQPDPRLEAEAHGLPWNDAWDAL